MEQMIVEIHIMVRIIGVIVCIWSFIGCFMLLNMFADWFVKKLEKK